MVETLQLPILIAAVIVMTWSVFRLRTLSIIARGAFRERLETPPEVLRWQSDLRTLSEELQTELDSKMQAVSALSEAYEQAAKRLSHLIQQAAMPTATPLILARNLQASGWSANRIAVALAIETNEVEALLLNQAGHLKRAS